MAAKRKQPASTARTPPVKQPRTQRTHTQDQSPFFRLPHEIRDIIYTEIFAAPATIHIGWVGARARKFRSFLCKLPVERQLDYDRTHPLPCSCSNTHVGCSPRASNKTANVRAMPTPAERRESRVMAMLQSCRRMYSETIEMLYTKNSFYFSNPRTALELPKYVPQSGLSLFRHLAVESPAWGEYSEPRIIRRWKEVVDALGLFNGLETLWIILYPDSGAKREIEELMNPIEGAALAVQPRISHAWITTMTPVLPEQGNRCPRHSNVNAAKSCNASLDDSDE